MTRINLGTSPAGPVSIDLDVLLRTRLLVQASSGGGKSWLLRRLMEQLFGNVQVLVIDPEGEFATLRERFDFVLAAPNGGDTPVTLRPRSPELLAHRLLELRSSAICDLYELPPRDRHEWVRRFLEALIDAPKKFWHGLIVVVDEAHTFAPEKGAGESVASDAMIGLATRGRKRGYCPVFATQRLGKLRKDAAAELLNVLIGQTFIDVDRKRAAEALGIAPADQRAFFDELRLLKPGKFWALGRAISTVRTLVTVGDVMTTHPEAGSAKHFSEPPPPSAKVKALLPKLADLPAEAEAKARSEAEMRAEIAALKRELAAKPAPEPAKVERVEVPVIEGAKLVRLDATISALSFKVDAMTEKVHAVADLVKGWRDLHEGRLRVHVPPPAPAPRRSTPAPVSVQRSTPAPGNGRDHHGEALRPMLRAILTALAQHPEGLTKGQILLHTGYRSSGPVSSAFAECVRSGWVDGDRSRLRITDTGLAALGSYEPLPVGDDLRERLLSGEKLTTMERALLKAVTEAYPESISKGRVLERARYASSGPVSSAFARLVRYGYVVAHGRGELRASEVLFG